MYIVLLRFTEQKHRAGEWMAAHQAWIQQGLDDGVFLLVGSLQPNQGGGILAHGESRAALQARVDRDPFVAEGVVAAEVLEISPSRLDDRVKFLGNL